MNEPGPMSTGGSQNRAPPSPPPDPRRRPGWSPYTGLQDPVVTGAARSSSDPTTTAAWYVTLLLQLASFLNNKSTERVYAY